MFLKFTQNDKIQQFIQRSLGNNVNIYNIIYCYDLRGSCSWESMKSHFNDKKFINRRNFWIEQAPLVEVINKYAVHTQRSSADSKGNQEQIYYLT